MAAFFPATQQSGQAQSSATFPTLLDSSIEDMEPLRSGNAPYVEAHGLEAQLNSSHRKNHDAPVSSVKVIPSAFESFILTRFGVA